MLLGIYRFVGDLGFTVGPITMGFVLNSAGFGAAAVLASCVAGLAIAVTLVQGRGRARRVPAETAGGVAAVR